MKTKIENVSVFFFTMDLVPNIENQKPEVKAELELLIQILVCL